MHFMLIYALYPSLAGFLLVPCPLSLFLDGNRP